MKCIIILLFMIPIFTYAQLPPNDPRYELVFEDEFDSLAMNINKWKSFPAWNQSGYKDVSYCNNIPEGIIRNDVVGYHKMNFENCLLDTTGSGTLKIVSKKERYLGRVWNWPLCTDDSCNTGTGYRPCDYNYNPPTCFDEDFIWFNYTTNEIISKENFKYGYFEIRCKIPAPTYPKTNTGIGPNFWLWTAGSEVTWSEIDIFEFDGSTNKFGSAIHYEDIHGEVQHGIPDHPPMIQVNDGKFHKYALHWEPDMIKFYFDDQLYISTPLYASNFLAMPIIIDVNFPLHTMCQLIDPINTQLPHYYEIDYVRVYQLIYDCNEDFHICNNISSDLIDYENISIGGNGCSPKITSGNTINITSNKVNVIDNFSIEAGGSLNYTHKRCYESSHIFPTRNNSEEIQQSLPERYNK